MQIYIFLHFIESLFRLFIDLFTSIFSQKRHYRNEGCRYILINGVNCCARVPTISLLVALITNFNSQKLIKTGHSFGEKWK